MGANGNVENLVCASSGSLGQDFLGMFIPA